MLFCQFLVGAMIAVATTESATRDAGHPLSTGKQAALENRHAAMLAAAEASVRRNPADVQAYSLRGDAHFFHGDYTKAVADFDRMVQIDPELEKSHWRRGIAQFMAGKYDAAVRQFELYRTFDDRDPETHYWLFLSRAKAEGLEKAREELKRRQKLTPEKGPAVMRFLAGLITTEQMLAGIRSEKIDEERKQRQLFYAHLYAGFGAMLEEQGDEAGRHFHAAVKNPWAESAGYGPNFMWHVARLQYDAAAEPAEALDR